MLSCLLDGIKCVFYTDAHTTLCNSRVPCGRNYHLQTGISEMKNENPESKKKSVEENEDRHRDQKHGAMALEDTDEDGGKRIID